MKEIVADTKMIAYCGLYCGACKSYLKGSCPGCAENKKATWCKIRSCNIEHGYASCADCNEFKNVMECKKFNNFIGRMFGVVFNSDRSACINMIKGKGYESYANFMAENKQQTIKRK